MSARYSAHRVETRIALCDDALFVLGRPLPATLWPRDDLDPTRRHPLRLSTKLSTSQ